MRNAHEVPGKYRSQAAQLQSSETNFYLPDVNVRRRNIVGIRNVGSVLLLLLL